MSDKKLKKQAGPPNRMNDLNYTEWMKFQKSFFRFPDTVRLTKEFIYFFTKATWSTGEPSRSLVINVEEFGSKEIPPPRIVLTPKDVADLPSLLAVLDRPEIAQVQYDFVFTDLRPIVRDKETLSSICGDQGSALFGKINHLLIPKRYCCFLLGVEGPKGMGFPDAWAIAGKLRECLKLRDEKVALVEADGSVFYCVIAQADEDLGPRVPLIPIEIACRPQQVCIPAWIIPRPRPRKKHEILHPAKFPEPLVAEFLKIFTNPGDNVFDPMVGTGSTMVAAAELNRNCYGLDLNPKYVAVANRRAESAKPLVLFQDMQSSAYTEAWQWNALELDKCEALSTIKFKYCITSPPYWSMLSNPGSENQEARRAKSLPLVYSENKSDLGNVTDYMQFLELLTSVYDQVASKLLPNGMLTIVVKNVKREHTLYTLAWDLVALLAGPRGRYEYLGNTLWCQDDIGLKPFAVGIHWVSNILHHYCLHFRMKN